MPNLLQQKVISRRILGKPAGGDMYFSVSLVGAAWGLSPVYIISLQCYLVYYK